MKLLVMPILLLILVTNIPMLISTLRHSLTLLDSLLVVSCINRCIKSSLSCYDHVLFS
jgi:hypothetical protein